MIPVLVLGFVLAIDPPLPTDAPTAGATTTSVTPGKGGTRTKGKGQDAADPPSRAPPSKPKSREDEEVIQNLELLEKLPLLDRLDLFDSAGDADAKSR